jgi:hypothetical protein
MKTNQYRGDPDPFSVPYSETDTVDLTDRHLDSNRVGPNSVFGVGNSPVSDVATDIAKRGPLPLRTMMVCFTVWLIATQAMIFDQLKFNERAHLLEQEARSLGGPQVVAPNEHPSNLPTDATVQRL